MASKKIIGIDLGTTNSVVAIMEGAEPKVLINQQGARTTPSVVAFTDKGERLVGQPARHQQVTNPTNTVFSIKRFMGRRHNEVSSEEKQVPYAVTGGPTELVKVQVRDKEYTPQEVSAMVLGELKQVAEDYLGDAIERAVITVPAYFNDSQRTATKEAGEIAGLKVERIINEPTAAALAYGFGRGLKQRVAIYDLGGGTFDISVLEIGDDVFEVLGTSGDTFLGGDDFDDRVIDLLADEFLGEHGINLRKDPYSFEKLKAAAERAKCGLSVDDEVTISIPDLASGPEGPLAIERTLSSAEFGTLVSDLIQRTFKVCDEVLQQSNVVARDLSGVVLVGGPTRLPIIRDAVRGYFQQDPKTDVDPDLVVAMGAAIHATALTSETQDSFLLDVTPLSLRIGVAGGLAETVIERNTPVPIEQTRTFTTFKDHQESVSIRVYQGESREAEENERLGQFEFSGFQKARRGEVEIDVTFEIDTDGIVKVTASDRTTGQEASTRITLASGLSESELQSIIEKGGSDRAAPQADPLAEDPPENAFDTQRDELDQALAELPLSDTQPSDTQPSDTQPSDTQRALLPEAPAADPRPPTLDADLDLDPGALDLDLEIGPGALDLAPAVDAVADSPTTPVLDDPPTALAPEAVGATCGESPAKSSVVFEEAPTDEMEIYSDDVDIELALSDEVTPADLEPAAPLEDLPKSPVPQPDVSVKQGSDLDFDIPEPAEIDLEIEIDPEPVVELTDELHIANALTASELTEAVTEIDPAEGDKEDLFENPGTDLTAQDGCEKIER